MITNVTVSQLFKKIEFKRAYTSCFLSSAGSEFQSLAPAIWKVFLPEEVLDCGTLRVPWFRRFLFWSSALLVR